LPGTTETALRRGHDELALSRVTEGSPRRTPSAAQTRIGHNLAVLPRSRPRQYDMRAVALGLRPRPALPERILMAAGATSGLHPWTNSDERGQKNAANSPVVRSRSLGLHGTTPTSRPGSWPQGHRLHFPHFRYDSRRVNDHEDVYEERRRKKTAPVSPRCSRPWHRRSHLDASADRPGIPRDDGPRRADGPGQRSRRSARSRLPSWRADSGGKGIQVVAGGAGEGSAQRGAARPPVVTTPSR